MIIPLVNNFFNSILPGPFQTLLLPPPLKSKIIISSKAIKEFVFRNHFILDNVIICAGIIWSQLKIELSMLMIIIPELLGIEKWLTLPVKATIHFYSNNSKKLAYRHSRLLNLAFSWCQNLLTRFPQMTIKHNNAWYWRCILSELL